MPTVWIISTAACMLTAGSVLFAAEGDISFEHDIRPIFKAHCLKCHGEDEPLQGGLDLRLVRLIKQGGDSGPSIVPGDPAASTLMTRIHDGEMPPEGATPLKPQQIELLERWIAGGAKTLRPEPATPESSAITADDREFWAFQPLKTGRPAVTETGARNLVDDFVRAKLSTEALPSSPEADRSTLLRRLTFTLTGLPPTWDEMQDYLAVDTPDAYERQVDRLLASPHGGERWARVWLDLGRYVDETPWWVVSAKNAWIYRDWVIRAFNEDRPFDDFVRAQLAADQLPNAEPAENAALGFLGLSPTYWKELRLSPDVIKSVVAEEWDERIDTISRTFLGLTVSCARCHDHKFDPVTMRDYYALAGVVASTQLVDKPQIAPAAAETVRVVKQQIADLQLRIDQLRTQIAAETKAAAEQQAKNAENPASNNQQAVAQPSPLLQRELESLERSIVQMKSSTSDFETPWVHAVEDTALIVQPDGSEKTRLEYRHGEVMDMPIFKRGNPSSPTVSMVPRRFLSVLSPEEPARFRHGSGRLELANSILNDARPLASRVQVNRIWAQHFGKGLVRTTSDFGRQGDPPSHPELLDAVAAEFIAHGWSHKWLHRRIVESATFRQTSRTHSAGVEQDPDNRLLWRMNRRRLDIEPYRDAILQASGRLDDRLYGPALSFDDGQNLRRTLYGKVVREEQHSMLRLYDFPDASAHSASREQTTTALQQLFVLNGPLFRDSAAVASGTNVALDSRTMIMASYQQLFQRSPTARELELGETFLSHDQPDVTGRRQAYLHALLGANEFLFID